MKKSGGKETHDSPIGNFKGNLHVSPDDTGYPTPSRAHQLGTSANYGGGTMLGEGYIGKRKIAEPVHTPGNLHAHQTLLDVTSKEHQVGKVRKQGTTPV